MVVGLCIGRIDGTVGVAHWVVALSALAFGKAGVRKRQKVIGFG